MRTVGLTGAVWIVCAGCFSLPSRPTGNEPTPDAPNADAPNADAPDALNGTCVPAIPADQFTGGAPCAAWSTNATSGLTVTNNTLEIRPVLQGAAGCVSDTAEQFMPQGIFVEISSVIDGTTDYTVFKQFPEVGGQAAASFVIDGNRTLSFFDDLVDTNNAVKSVTYDPTTMRWLRLRPSGNVVTGDISPDGLSWTELARTAPATIPAKVLLQIAAGTFQDPTQGVTGVRNLNSCP